MVLRERGSCKESERNARDDFAKKRRTCVRVCREEGDEKASCKTIKSVLRSLDLN